jgi:hypothetical protein
MPIYTVHEPPLRAAEVLPDPARFALVRDGFHWWAFLLTPFWMVRHGLWLVLIVYLAISIALDVVLRILGASHAAIFIVAVLISLWVGLEAATLQRFTLNRRRWKNVGVVSGDDLEDAEWRFFDAWLRKPPARAATPGAPPPAAEPVAPAPRPGDTSGVIGLFPEPGARR